MIADRAHAIEASGIRRILELASSLKNPVNLSIGQPDFPVPDPIKNAAIDAIRTDRNGYTLTQGIPELRAAISAHLASDLNWNFNHNDDPALLVTSGTSGGLLLAAQALLNPGDEIIIPDPYFLIYPAIATLCAAHAVPCNTAPHFRLTAELVEPLITPRTKFVLFNSPSNPAGVVSTEAECRDLLDLCRARNILLISDEIYDGFTYSESRTQRTPHNQHLCPSPARLEASAQHVLLIRGFGKTYGCTGWRLGYAAGPRPIIEQMAKIQQYTFVCAPSPLQHGAIAALSTDITPIIAEYESRRDLVVNRLSQVTDLPFPGGAFYAYPRVPAHLGLTASQFVERCIERELLLVPGKVFSTRDTHIRLSFAVAPDKLARGLDILVDLMSR